jgi:anti-sigma B factor antagonist
MTTTGVGDDGNWDEAQQFSCHEEVLDDGGVLVRAAGELDIHTCSAFQDVLVAARDRRPTRLVVDLSEVTFIDSTALGVLVVLQRGMRRPLDIVVTRPDLRRVLLITGLDMVFTLHPSVEEARRRAA